MRAIKITKKPWGEEHLIASTDRYSGKLIHIRRGHRLSLQYHTVKDETFYVLRGRLSVAIGAVGRPLRKRRLGPGDTLHLPPRTVHRTEALTDCCLVEVSTPELWDIVRLADDYRRPVAAAPRCSRRSTRQ